MLTMIRFILCLVSTFVIVTCDLKYVLQTKYIDVPLDHFSFTKSTTFKLRYLINDTYHEPGAPIFFYTGNEGDIDNFAQNTGFMFDIAPDFHALLVFAEHRYYGESLPFGNESYSNIDNLGYLSSQQALADYVFLIEHLQNDYGNQESHKKLPVIAFGGSYGGMLASWMRMRYPSTILGAISSSAPIWQFTGLVPCDIFHTIATTVYSSFGSDNCSNAIKRTWPTIRNFAKTSAGKGNLSSLWQLCSPLAKDDDIQTLIDWVGEIIADMAMANYPYPNSFLVDLPAYPVLEFCKKLGEYSVDSDYGLLGAIGEALTIYTNFTGKATCNSIYHTTSKVDGNGWYFQSCTDMIMPWCSTDKDMFDNVAWDFQKFSDECHAKFNVRPRSEDVPILEYGGKDIEFASNIVFSNGLLDPWSGGGVLRNINHEISVVLIPDGAHHYDLRGTHELDTEDVKQTRLFHVKKIREWLRKYNTVPSVVLV